MTHFFLSILITFILVSCAHIKPTNQSPELEEPSGSIYIPDDEQIAESPEQAPVYKKNDRNFLARRNSKKVDFWINYFAKKNKARLERFVANGEKYKKTIQETFKRYGLPAELYYVGLIESGYYTGSRSHAGAVGPWQFIASTAKRYGLQVNRSVDERKNIYKSTEAAALFFQDLYNIFGSWELALAAYNKGENGVIRRIRGANTRDYYELCEKKVLPKETRHYVPKVLAVMTILENAKQYNVAIKKWSDNPFDNAEKIEISKSLPLSQVASKLNTTTTMLRELNADLRQRHTPYPGRNGFELYVPATSRDHIKTLETYMASYKAKRSYKSSQGKSQIHTHTVRRNESLYSLAKRYELSIKEIKRINNLRSNTIYVGQKIKVKTSSSSKILYSYVVKKGDNLYQIARLFKLNIKQLKKMNKLKSSVLHVVKKLQVPPHRVKTYTVKSGEYLGKIAKRTQTNVSELIQLNGGNKRIYPGQKLIISLEPI